MPLKPNKIEIHTLDWNNLNYFSTKSDEVRQGYYLNDRGVKTTWLQSDYRLNDYCARIYVMLDKTTENGTDLMYLKSNW